MRTLLYVEDEPDDVILARFVFKQLRFEVRLEVAPDGGAAIDYLSGTGAYSDRGAHPLPDIVLLDLKLPVKSGFEVLAWIRQQSDFTRLPVIIYSSSGADSDRQKAFLLGASEYLVKPSGLAPTKEAFTHLHQRWFSPAEARPDFSPPAPAAAAQMTSAGNPAGQP
ncbi:MAG: response regulator [Verrucomicrobiota bacterium]